MVPPTPGPLAAAGTLGADLGMVIGLGLISAFFYTAAAMVYVNSKSMQEKFPKIHVMENVDTVLNDDFTIKSEKKLPSAFLTFSVILVPVLLICLNSFAKIGMPADAPILKFLGFIGHPIISLSIGIVLFAKFLNLFRKHKINPMVGAAGISAFPMSARVIQKMATAEDNQNFILMHAVGANVSGQIASVIAGGLIMALVQ